MQFTSFFDDTQCFYIVSGSTDMGARIRLAICFLASIVYYNTLDAGFVYDDR